MRFLAVAFAALLLLSGCTASGSPSPGTEAPPTLGSQPPETAPSDAPTGSSAIGSLGDPCELLTSDEVAAATGHAVLAVVRGEAGADGTQSCAWAVDAPGVTAGMAAAFGIDPSAPEIGPFLSSLQEGGSTGMVGIVVTRVDAPVGDDSGDGGPADPNVVVTEVPIGEKALVVSTPNGGAGFCYVGADVAIQLMWLIQGTPTPATLASTLTVAYDRY